MIRMVSCGGVVIHKGKMLLLYKDYKQKYVGWVLPKGTVEPGETHQTTALREVREETGVEARIIRFIGSSEYTFQGHEDRICKTVHWYLMQADSFYCKPQREEYFIDAGYYKYYEAYHLLKFSDERYILKKAYHLYNEYRGLHHS
ncbi:hydrolase [Sporanaerobium hydrogeniformans]|uniref:Hydrolase n=1 Tax=Sporanaerobium hydrogeniformans TaxID=3072179 RepID=A0AC61DES2_9FIRM|nr:NUDIX hydrolase [Sporanaerobium hydrogeniformans]PHV71057.1 hydrolase [Sporanaerobium hydrogeniformans]